MTFQGTGPSCPHYVHGFQWYSYQATEFFWFYVAEIKPQASNGVLLYRPLCKREADLSFFQERPIAYHRQKYDATRKIYYLSYMNQRLQY